MAEFPALPLWTDAYLGDTTHLTTIEHGAYLLLLMAMWRSNGSLPNDDAKLARYARLTPGQWARIKPTIMEFFRAEDGRISQGRLTDELKAVRQNSSRQSNKARARWLKNKEASDAAAMPNECRSDASLPLPLPIEEREIPSESPAQPALRGARFEEFWDAWPLAKTGRKRAEASFNRLSPENRAAAKDNARPWAEHGGMSDKRLHSNAFSPKIERPEPVFHHRPGLTETEPMKEARAMADPQLPSPDDLRKILAYDPETGYHKNHGRSAPEVQA